MIQFLLPLIFTIAEPSPTPTPAPTPIAIAQAAPIDIGRDATNRWFAFDWDGNHDDGSPGAEVAQAEFQFSPPAGGGQQRWVKVDHVGTAGENRVPVSEALVGVPAGIYDLQVRLLDPGGQPSTYTPVLSIRVRVKNPSAPQNVRVVGG